MKQSLKLFASYYLVLACSGWLLMGLLAFFRPLAEMNIWYFLFMVFVWILPAFAGIYVFFAYHLWEVEPPHEQAQNQVATSSNVAGESHA